MGLKLEEVMSYFKKESWTYRAPTPLGDPMRLLTPRTISLWVKYVPQLCILDINIASCHMVVVCSQVVYGSALPAVPVHVPYSSFVAGTQPPQLCSASSSLLEVCTVCAWTPMVK